MYDVGVGISIREFSKFPSYNLYCSSWRDVVLTSIVNAYLMRDESKQILLDKDLL